MNWLLISVAAILVIAAIVGFAKGAIRIAVSLVATILTMLLVFFMTPYVGKAITSLTPVDEWIEEKCLNTMANAFTGGDTEESGLTEDKIRSILESAGVSEEELAAAGITIQDILDGKISGEDLTQYGIAAGVLAGLQSGSTDKVEESILDAEVPRQTQIAAIEAADLPAAFKELLLSNNNSEVYASLGVSTFAEYISKYLSKLIIELAAFLVTFLFITIIVRAIIFALDIVSELPVLGILNRFAGMGIGLVIGLIVIGFCFTIVTLLYTTSFGKMMMEMIESNQFLSFLYENNLIMKIATIFR